MKDVANVLVKLVRRHGIKSITADNGTEFHDYKRVERLSGAKFYFAAPYHSWERGTSENTNGLIRQYLPRKMSFSGLTQRTCNSVALKLNTRPRKILNLKTPQGAHYGTSLLLHFTVDSVGISPIPIRRDEGLSSKHALSCDLRKPSLQDTFLQNHKNLS